MACTKCGGAIGPWVNLKAEAKAWKQDEPVLIDVEELKADLCLHCSRELRAWLTPAGLKATREILCVPENGLDKWDREAAKRQTPAHTSNKRTGMTEGG